MLKPRIILQRIKADTTLKIRCLEEPDQWIEFFEYFDEVRDMYLPQVEGVRTKRVSSKRYLINALDVQESKVIPLVLTKTAVSQLVKYYEKFSTILDRDYNITRTDTGFDTDYDVEPSDPRKLELNGHTKHDLMLLLENQVILGL